jgi:hypothetical protein
MTEEEAKGYCNLRHHGATGEWPAQHAKRGKMLTKAADGSGEARVPAGHVTGGQFTAGSDGPTKNPPKPNPYGKKGKKGSGGKGPKGKRGTAGPGSKGKSAKARRAALRQRIAGLESKLSGLEREEKSLKGSGVSGQASTRTGTQGSSVSSNAQASTSQSSSSGKPGSSSSSSGTSKLAQVQAEIKQVRAQIAAARQQLAAIKSVGGDVTKASRNVRDTPSGRFRTFEGESKEAATAFQEGRVHDAVDLLGSARALATEPGHRTTLDSLQRHISRLQHVVPEVTKGFIRGDSIAHGDKTGFHEGSAGGGHVYLRTRDGVRHRVPVHEIRATSDDENEDLYRQETDPGLPEPPEEDTKPKGSR